MESQIPNSDCVTTFSLNNSIAKEVNSFKDNQNADEEDMVEGSLAFSDSDDESRISLFFNGSENEESKEAVQKTSEQKNKSNMEITINEISPIKFFERTILAKEKENSNLKNKEENINVETMDYQEDLKHEDSYCLDSETPNKNKNLNKLKSYSNIIDSDSEDNMSNKEIYEFKSSSDEDQNIYKLEEKKKKVRSPKNKVVRQSAKAAMETINTIKSETQRLHRENNVNIPYHHPKKCTLKEFMARKTALKPDVESKQFKRYSLKMTDEELKDYAQFLEKRLEETEELFIEKEVDDNVTSNNLNYVNVNVEINDEQNSNVLDNNKNIELLSESVINVQSNINNNSNNCIATITSDSVDSNNEDIILNENPLTTGENCDALGTEQSNVPKIQIISNVQISPAIAKPAISVVKQLKQQIVNEAINTNFRPKLEGSPASIIDLETGDILASPRTLPLGLDALLERCIKGNSREKDLKSNIKNGIFASRNCCKDNRPGSNYVKLKDSLLRKIKEQRKIEINKKLKHYKEEEEIALKIFEEEDDEGIDYDPFNKNNDENDNENKEVIDIESNDEIDDEGNDEIDDEIEDEFDDEINQNDKLDDLVISDVEADDESEESNNRNQAKRKNKRIMKNINESSSENDEINEDIGFSLKYPLEITEVENPGINIFHRTALQELCDKNTNTICNDEELLELCSGTFDKTQTNLTNISQAEANTKMEKTALDNNVNTITNTISKDNIDDAGESSEEEILSTTKKQHKIIYSDEEDNFNDDKNSVNVKSNIDESEIIESEPIATYIDYDSDENEIQVEITKKDINTKANEYLELEAELSESEWGSADEDEKNMDKYDIELGDEDEYDQEKLKDELGRIHLRKMLDEDVRQLKKVQQLFFDDEENDGIGRQRQFRWKKVETGFNLDDNSTENNDIINIDSNDEDDEEHWRKMKHERNVILEENSKMISTSKNSSKNINENAEEKKLIMSRINNISISKPKLIETESSNDSPFLISKLSIKSNRGSFLKRNGDILTKVANITTHISEFDGISTVQSHTGKNKNFVFSIQSEKPVENNKRKLSSAPYVNGSKKVKLHTSNSTNKKRLIDSLNDM